MARRSPVTTLELTKAPPLWAHQQQTLKFLKTRKRAFDFSAPGCVSADTEYLTPTGWKRIDQYAEGDMVAQFHPDTREIEFVAPTEYVKRPCDRMVVIEPARGTSQRLSEEHRVLVYDSDWSWDVLSAAQYMLDHNSGEHRFRARKFACTYSVRGMPGLALSDAELRVMVAVIADSHIRDDSKNCTIRIKKLRKIVRLRELLKAARISYAERTCGGQPDFQVFTFVPPRRDKVFNAWWWQASQKQLEVIADELPHWDGSKGKRPSGGCRFSTSDERSADFAQYAFAAAKHPATVGFNVRSRRGRLEVDYSVHAREQDAQVGPGRVGGIYLAKNPEGFKYCFEVPSTFLLLRRQGRIFATGNTGKTRAHIEDYANRPKPKGRLLVIAPKTLMDAAWAEDIQKYAPQLTVALAYAENREEAFKMKTDVVVINHDGVKWLDDKKNSKYLEQFDHLVIDEGNAYKNPKSQRSKAMVRIRKYFEWRRLLTGTPNPNSVMELWNPAMIVDDGKRLGNSYFKLRSSVQSPTQVGPSANMIRWDDKPGATQAVNELIGDITIRHAFEDVMTHVPPNHRHTKTFKLSPKTRKIYDKLENDFVAEFDNKDYVDAVHAAALRTKLLQIASGAVYTSTDENSGYTLVDTTRYDLIADLVEEREHCVVFFNWRHQRDYLVKAFAARDISCAVIDGSVSKDARIQIVKDYQAGKYKVILLHPRTGAHGLTLTMGTTTIFSSPIYEADLMEQGIARIVRGMQDKVTNTIFIEADNTVEAGVYARLNKKAFNMNDLLDLMRHRRKKH